ncbi:lachesin-like isoform X1, partial [Vespula squamosa]
MITTGFENVRRLTTDTLDRCTFARDQKLAESVTGNHNASGAPSFDLNVQRNVTTAVGQTAFLHCRVHHMGDKERLPQKTLTALTRDEGFVVFASPQRCLAVFRLDPLIEYACGLVKELNGLKFTMNSARNKFLNLFCHPVLCMKQKFSIT